MPRPAYDVHFSPHSLHARVLGREEGSLLMTRLIKNMLVMKKLFFHNHVNHVLCDWQFGLEGESHQALY